MANQERIMEYGIANIGTRPPESPTILIFE